MLSEEAVTENGHTQEEDAVDVANIPPQRHLRGVRQLPLQLFFLLRGQLDGFLLLQAAEAHQRLLAKARFLLGFCNRGDKGSVKAVCLLMCQFFTSVRQLITIYVQTVGIQLVINPVVLFKVHPLLRVVPQAPTQSIQLKQQHAG